APCAPPSVSSAPEPPAPGAEKSGTARSATAAANAVPRNARTHDGSPPERMERADRTVAGIVPESLHGESPACPRVRSLPRRDARPARVLEGPCTRGPCGKGLRTMLQ